MHIEGIAEIRGTDCRIPHLTEVRATMSGSCCEPHPGMMPAAAMRVPETVTTEMAAAMMATTMPATMTTSVPATMTASVPTAMAAAALPQSRARQHAGKRHHGNSNDRSQHRILPQRRAIEASEAYGNWNRPGCGKFLDRDAASTATPPARSCRD
ncbi:hypothetical protein ABIB73_002267 [Bradyrhizobium sp. F1.4.3]|uniref:hypothetical protein n=1 Tax=Bradyrhizobium sp. F1.4.3 TaxID=3156356 RepID=UPI00339A9BDB